MSSGRIAAALGLSIGLHLAGIGWLRGRLPSLRSTGDPAPTAEVPLTILGGGESPAPARAGARTPERRVVGVGRARGGRTPPSVAHQDSVPVAALEDGAPEAENGLEDDPVPGWGSASGPGARVVVAIGSAGGAGVGSGRGATIDLEPFVERLRRSAEHCGSAPPRGRTDRRGRAPVGLVRFCVAPDGAPTAVSLVESTGDPALDRAAVDCIVPGAAPLPPTDTCLVVPLRFH